MQNKHMQNKPESCWPGPTSADTLQQLDQQTLADGPNNGWQPTVSLVFQGPNIHNLIINGFKSRI